MEPEQPSEPSERDRLSVRDALHTKVELWLDLPCDKHWSQARGRSKSVPNRPHEGTAHKEIANPPIPVPVGVNQLLLAEADSFICYSEDHAVCETILRQLQLKIDKQKAQIIFEKGKTSVLESQFEQIQIEIMRYIQKIKS